MTWPTKDDFVDGDVLTAAQVNNIADNLNLFDPTSATSGQVPVADGAGSVAWGGVASGLNLITPSTVTATSGTIAINTNGSVSLTTVTTAFSINGVFSSTYKNYLVLMDVVASGSAAVNLRLRAAGTDSATDYYTQRLQASSTTVSGSLSSATTSAAIFSGSSDTVPMGIGIWLFGPQLTRQTALRVVNATSFSIAQKVGFQDYVHTHDLATSYDGFSMIYSPQTLTGQIAVYGIRD